MGTWKVDAVTTPGILRLTLEGRLSVDEMAAFCEAHNRAINEYRGADYKVWCDLSRLQTLDQECVRMIERSTAVRTRTSAGARCWWRAPSSRCSIAAPRSMAA